MIFSPWESAFQDGYKVKLSSPDKKYEVEIRQLIEVAMGGPTRGELFLDGERVYGEFVDDSTSVDYGFSPCCIWSDDSKYLALYKWMPLQRVQLVIYEAETKNLHDLDSKFSVSSAFTEFKFGILYDGIRKLEVYKKLGVPVPVVPKQAKKKRASTKTVKKKPAKTKNDLIADNSKVVREGLYSLENENDEKRDKLNFQIYKYYVLLSVGMLVLLGILFVDDESGMLESIGRVIRILV